MDRAEEMRASYREAAEKFVEGIQDVYGRLESSEYQLESVQIMRMILEEEIKKYEDELIPVEDDPGRDDPNLLYLAHAYRTYETTRARAIILEKEISHLKGIIESVRSEVLPKVEEI